MARRLLLVLAILAAGSVPAMADWASQDDAYCQSLGAKPGTDIYFQCRFTLDQNRKDRQRRALGIIGRSLMQMGQPPRTTTCTTTRLGNTLQTNCF